jgi:hypothetical protein
MPPLQPRDTDPADEGGQQQESNEQQEIYDTKQRGQEALLGMLREEAQQQGHQVLEQADGQRPPPNHMPWWLADAVQHGAEALAHRTACWEKEERKRAAFKPRIDELIKEHTQPIPEALILFPGLKEEKEKREHKKAALKPHIEALVREHTQPITL